MTFLRLVVISIFEWLLNEVCQDVKNALSVCSFQMCGIFILVHKFNLSCVFVRCSGLRITHAADRWPLSNSWTSCPAWPSHKQIYNTVSQQANIHKTHILSVQRVLNILNCRGSGPSFGRKIGADFIMHSAFLKQMPEWHKL